MEHISERLTQRNIAGVAVYKTAYECERCGEAIYRLPDYGNGSPTERLAKYEEYNTLRPVEEWHEDYGDCLFWKLPIMEPPYCGSPLDSVWEERGYDEYFTHFTRLTPPIGADISD